MRTYIRIVDNKGEYNMTANEIELINIIRENDNPGKALMAAAVIVLGFLKRLESSSKQEPADLRVLS